MGLPGRRCHLPRRQLVAVPAGKARRVASWAVERLRAPWVGGDHPAPGGCGRGRRWPGRRTMEAGAGSRADAVAAPPAYPGTERRGLQAGDKGPVQDYT